MLYKKFKNKIEIYDKSQFQPQHILECGQVFCFEQTEQGYTVFPGSHFAKIQEKDDCYQIFTTSADFFEEYFDLKTDYTAIKDQLFKTKILSQPIKFGYGIRILKQDLFEVLISFIISANNNIGRIKLILSRLRRHFSSLMQPPFPTYQQLLSCSCEFFKSIGCGYRSQYLYNVLRQTSPKQLQEWCGLGTTELRKNLIKLSGVGPKVADCVLLFGYGRKDVFPVDTWINQMYNKFYQPLSNREQIRNNLIAQFGDLSGYAQQYLFYYQRSFLKK